MEQARLWFSKTKTAEYISHLDLTRCVERAVKRANLPLWHTEGFNPHPYLVFALPLPLGFSGLREALDVRLLSEVDKESVIGALNAALYPSGIEFFDLTVPEKKIGEIANASYEIVVSGITAETYAALCEAETVVVEKRSKSSSSDFDVLPYLKSAVLSEQTLSVTLPAGSNLSVSPKLLLDGIRKTEPQAEFVKICRTGLLTADFEKFQ